MLYSTLREFEMIYIFQVVSFSHIFPTLRLVSMLVEGPHVTLYFYVDGLLSKDDDDSINQIGNYFDTDFAPGETFWMDINRCDYPAPIPYFPGECVYARWEDPPLVKLPRELLLGTAIDRRLKVLIAIQRAMVNHIFPQLYVVEISWTESTANILIYFEGRISDTIKNLSEAIRAHFFFQFPPEEMRACDVQMISIDPFKDKFLENSNTLVFLKKIRPESDQYS